MADRHSTAPGPDTEPWEDLRYAWSQLTGDDPDVIWQLGAELVEQIVGDEDAYHRVKRVRRALAALDRNLTEALESTINPPLRTPSGAIDLATVPAGLQSAIRYHLDDLRSIALPLLRATLDGLARLRIRPELFGIDAQQLGLLANLRIANPRLVHDSWSTWLCSVASSGVSVTPARFNSYEVRALQRLIEAMPSYQHYRMTTQPTPEKSPPETPWRATSFASHSRGSHGLDDEIRSMLRLVERAGGVFPPIAQAHLNSPLASHRSAQWYRGPNTSGLLVGYTIVVLVGAMGAVLWGQAGFASIQAQPQHSAMLPLAVAMLTFSGVYMSFLTGWFGGLFEKVGRARYRKICLLVSVLCAVFILVSPTIAVVLAPERRQLYSIFPVSDLAPLSFTIYLMVGIAGIILPIVAFISRWRTERRAVPPQSARYL